MKILISPSKSVTVRAQPLELLPTTPLFEHQTADLLSRLCEVVRANELGQVLGVSDNLATLNVERYQNWDDPTRRRSAIWLYSGDVYNGLDAFSLSCEAAEQMQRDLLIVSGLYGLVRPLDLIQPYRLDMGTRLQGSWGKDLYSFWGNTLAEHIEELGTKIVLVCASREYSRAVLPRLGSGVTVITPRFLQSTATGLKEKSLFAKHARGTLARWVVNNRVNSLDELRGFDVDGFAHSAELSKPGEPVFLVPPDFTLLGRYVKI